MCATRNLKVLLLERDKLGGLLATLYPTKIVPNYPGFPDGIVAIELVRNWLRHLRFTAVTFKQETVKTITRNLTIKTDENNYRSKAVVIATGTEPRRLGIQNEVRFSKAGKGVHYFASHPEEFVGKRVLVVEDGPTLTHHNVDRIARGQAHEEKDYDGHAEHDGDSNQDPFQNFDTAHGVSSTITEIAKRRSGIGNQTRSLIIKSIDSKAVMARRTRHAS